MCEDSKKADPCRKVSSFFESQKCCDRGEWCDSSEAGDLADFPGSEFYVDAFFEGTRLLYCKQLGFSIPEKISGSEISEFLGAGGTGGGEGREETAAFGGELVAVGLASPLLIKENIRLNQRPGKFHSAVTVLEIVVESEGEH